MADASAQLWELAAKGLRLRPYRGDDAPALLAAVQESLDSVGRWLPWCHSGYAMADAMDWIRHCDEGRRNGEHLAFAVFDESSGDFIGAAGLHQRNREHNFMSLGYWIRQSRQGRGIARRAAGCVVDFGFEHVKLTRIEIVVQPDNQASRRVAEALGARFEAIARNRLLVCGKPADAAVYAVVPNSAETLPRT